MAGKPISPSEVVSAKREAIPEAVFNAFNKLIAEKWNGHCATIRQEEVVALIAAEMSLESTQVIYEKHWLDIEKIYEQAGWKVTYDKPAYCESYPATFKFEKNRTRSEYRNSSGREANW